MSRWPIALAICGGCNWAFGLEATKASDAQPDAQFGYITMEFLVGGADMANQTPVATAPLTDPKGAYAQLDGAFTPIMYDVARGEFPYPAHLANEVWRFEYTPPGDVPHELQWQPAEGAGHVAIPIFGRVERVKRPASTGFRLSPAATFFPDQTTIMTTGYWSSSTITGNPTTFDLDFATTPPRSGGFAATAAKDVIVALGPDAPVQTVPASPSCVGRGGIAASQAPEVFDGVLAPVSLVNDTTLGSASFIIPPGVLPGPRLTLALGGTGANTRADDPNASAIYVGRLAHSLMPAFTSRLDLEDVPAPLMIPLVKCPPIVNGVASFLTGGRDLGFELATYAAFVNERVVSGVTLRSSLVGITVKGADDNYVLDFPVKIATAPLLGSNDLDAGADNQAIENTPVDLTFSFEALEGAEVHYFEVTLYRLAASSLVPIRVYTSTSSTSTGKIHFDPSVMTPGVEHVFAIRTYRGRPQARAFDFRPVAMPQAVASVFTRTFHR